MVVAEHGSSWLYNLQNRRRWRSLPLGRKINAIPKYVNRKTQIYIYIKKTKNSAWGEVRPHAACRKRRADLLVWFLALKRMQRGIGHSQSRRSEEEDWTLSRWSWRKNTSWFHTEIIAVLWGRVRATLHPALTGALHSNVVKQRVELIDGCSGDQGWRVGKEDFFLKYTVTWEKVLGSN